MRQVLRATWIENRRVFIAAMMLSGIMAAALAMGGILAKSQHDTGMRDLHIVQAPGQQAINADAENRLALSSMLLLGEVLAGSLFTPLYVCFVMVPAITRSLRHRDVIFAWTQGVTQRRWLVATSAAFVTFGLLAGTVWTAGALAALAHNGWQIPGFAVYNFGIVGFAQFLVLLALGAWLAMRLRSSIPVQGITFLAWALLLVGLGRLRQIVLSGAVQTSPKPPLGSLTLSVLCVSRSGSVLGQYPIGCNASTHTAFSYISPDWFWPLQGTEFLLLGVVALLIGWMTMRSLIRLDLPRPE